MKNLFSYNLITILNCAKIKALTGKSLNFSNFYQVDFDELEELEIENVVKAIGLYPVLFFSLKTTHSPISIKEALPIKNLWHSLHFSNHIHGTKHALTLTSQINEPHNLHERDYLSGRRALVPTNRTFRLFMPVLISFIEDLRIIRESYKTMGESLGYPKLFFIFRT